MNARIVRQVVGDRLVAVPQVARPEWGIHHFHRRHVAAHRGPIDRRERQRILDVRHPLLILREVAALGFVANQNRRAVRRFHAEQIVQIGFVGREDHVNLGVLQLDPRDIAGVVIVGRQRIGAHPQKPGERRIRRERRGAAQRRCGAGDEWLELIVVRPADQVRSLTAHQRVAAVDLVFPGGMAARRSCQSPRA